MIEIVFEISVENSSVCSFEHKMCFSFCVTLILSLVKGELCQKKIFLHAGTTSMNWNIC